jgi:hypothetical protein
LGEYIDSPLRKTPNHSRGENHVFASYAQI